MPLSPTAAGRWELSVDVLLWPIAPRPGWAGCLVSALGTWLLIVSLDVAFGPSGRAAHDWPRLPGENSVRRGTILRVARRSAADPPRRYGTGVAPCWFRGCLACRALLRWLRVPCGGTGCARAVGGRAASLRLAGSVEDGAGGTAGGRALVRWLLFLVAAGLG